MAGYEFHYDKASGIVRCRMLSFLSDVDARHYARDIKAVVDEARADSPTLRILFDNREGIVVSSGVLAHFAEALREMRHPDDRVAILVNSSLAKIQAKRSTSAGSEVFISESAALTWLDAWKN